MERLIKTLQEEHENQINDFNEELSKLRNENYMMKERQSFVNRGTLGQGSIRDSELCGEYEDQEQLGGAENMMDELGDNMMTGDFVMRGTHNSNIMAGQSDFYSQRGTVISEAPSNRQKYG